MKKPCGIVLIDVGGNMRKEKPKLTIDIDGPDGNVLFMLVKVKGVLLKERRINDYNELKDKVLQSRYPQGIYQMSELVEFIDISASQTLAEKIKQGKIINEQLAK